MLFLDFWPFMTLEVESKEDPNKSRAMSNQPNVLISLFPGWFWSLRINLFWIWPLLSLLFYLSSLIMHTYILVWFCFVFWSFLLNHLLVCKGESYVRSCQRSLLSCSIISDSLWPPWTITHQVPLSLEFSSQEYWNRLPFPTPGDLPNTGTKPALAGGFFTTEWPGKSNSIF